MDLDTGKPKDTLNPHAQHQIQALGSHNTKVSEIVIQQDTDVFKAIKEGLDKVNEDNTAQAQRVCLPCIILAELISLLFMRVGRISHLFVYTVSLCV